MSRGLVAEVGQCHSAGPGRGCTCVRLAVPAAFDLGPAPMASDGSSLLCVACQRAYSYTHRRAATSEKRSTQNWHGQGESDCLIKTKHCDGVYNVSLKNRPCDVDESYIEF